MIFLPSYYIIHLVQLIGWSLLNLLFFIFTYNICGVSLPDFRWTIKIRVSCPQIQLNFLYNAKKWSSQKWKIKLNMTVTFIQLDTCIYILKVNILCCGHEVRLCEVICRKCVFKVSKCFCYKWGNQMVWYANKVWS